MNIIKPSITMRLEPSEDSPLETECLFGETVEVIEEFSGWAYCRLTTDNYYGWIKKNGIGELKEPTHRVNAIRTFVYVDKDPKSICINYLPMCAKLVIGKIDHDWAEIFLSKNDSYKIAYVPTKHIIRLENKKKRLGCSSRTIDWNTV